MTARAQGRGQASSQHFPLCDESELRGHREIICALCLPMAGPSDGSHNLTDRDYKILAVIMLRIDRTLLLYDKPVFLLL